MGPVLALAFGPAGAFKPEVYVLLLGGGNVVIGPSTAVTVDGVPVPRLCADGGDRKAALLAWVSSAPAPAVTGVTNNPPHVVPTSLALESGAAAPPP